MLLNLKLVEIQYLIEVEEMGVRVAQSLTCRQSVFDRNRKIGVRVAQSLTCR